MKKYTQVICLAAVLGVLLGCSASPQVVNSDTVIKATAEESTVPTKTPEEVSESDAHAESANTEEVTVGAADPVINRPVITLKRDMYFVDEGLYPDGFDNIASITDVEDGELVYEDRWYGGLLGEMVDVYKNLFLNPHDRAYEFFNPGRKIILTNTVETQELDGFKVRLVRILAYDSDGNVSYADYHATEIPNDNPSAIMTGKVIVDGLRVRDAASTSGNVKGYAWNGLKYLIYETVTADGYTWYRIGKDLWIADDGTWIEQN